MDALVLVVIGFVGTFFWLVSPEAAAALQASQRGWSPVLVGLLVAVGQGAAHLTLWTGGAQLRRRWAWFDRKCERAVRRHGTWLARGVIPLGLSSGLVGLPPSSVTAALAPGLRLRGPVLLPLLFAARLVRLIAVALIASRVGPAVLHR
jgi:hypothetical protein